MEANDIGEVGANAMFTLDNTLEAATLTFDCFIGCFG